MKKLVLFCFLASASAAFAMPQDSIGVKVVDGKSYIMHKVSKGEGVYGIAKKYGVPAADIFNANEGSKTNIKIDQVLLVPKSGLSTSTKPSSTSTASATTKTEKIYHTVAAGQTLSSIARQYKTTVAEIKTLNNLNSDNIALGKKLIVGTKTVSSPATKPAETVTPEPQPTIAVEEPKIETPQAIKTTPTTNNNVVVTNTPKVEEPIKSSQVINNTYSTDDGDEISENGIAIISNEGELSQERSFIMHPTAKIGTIVMITNPVNNNTTFARVVGNCKCDDGTILKMSKTVASKIGANENIQVKLSYAK